MALAAEQPLGLFDLRMELYGYLYLKIPNTFIYSAEDLAHLTPSIRYKPFNWLYVDLGIDFRLSSAERQRTEDVPDVSEKLDLPSSYPPWKVHLGLQFNVLPVGGSKSYDLDIRNPEERRRLEYYDLIMKETEKAKAIEKKVQQMRKERETADKEIDNIKEELDEEG
jgi:hypothetical protein